MVGAIAFCRSVIDLLSMFQWYRKLRGGHWELWWIDAPVSSHVWLQKDHIGDLTGEDIAKNDVFVLLEYCNFPYSDEQHRLHILTKNGTTGWLTLSNVLTDYIVPASM